MSAPSQLTADTRRVLGPFTRTDLSSAGRIGLILGLWIGTIGLALDSIAFYAHRHWLGADTHAYWQAARTSHPYLAPPGNLDAYEYAPVFQQLSRPFGLLPFPVFHVLWLVIELAIYVHLTRGLGWRWRVPVLCAAVPELCLGNIYGFFSLVLAYGLTRPWLWAFPALTKITPSGTGLLWFAVRGEWRRLRQALAATIAIVAVSATVQPSLWREWWTYLQANSATHLSGILIRCGVAGIVTLVAARRGWAWLLPAAFIFCAPVQGGLNKDYAMVPVTVFLWLNGRQQKESA